MCSYCGVDGHTRDECLDRQEREIGTERQYDDPLEVCPDCGTANNRSVNDSCWRCGHEFVDRKLVTDGGSDMSPSGTDQLSPPTTRNLSPPQLEQVFWPLGVTLPLSNTTPICVDSHRTHLIKNNSNVDSITWQNLGHREKPTILFQILRLPLDRIPTGRGDTDLATDGGQSLEDIDHRILRNSSHPQEHSLFPTGPVSPDRRSIAVYIEPHWTQAAANRSDWGIVLTHSFKRTSGLLNLHPQCLGRSLHADTGGSEAHQ